MHLTRPDYLHNVTGTVIEIYPLSKAVIRFYHGGTVHRALLWANRLVVLGKPDIAITDDISVFVEVGCTVTFQCHSFDLNGKDACNWFVIIAMRQEMCDREINNMLHFGLVSAQGEFSLLCRKQGVILYVDESGKSHRVLCHALNIHAFGKRLTSKQRVDKVMSYGQMYNFDAVPTNPMENKLNCPWVATAVWMGFRPEDPRRLLPASKEKPRVRLVTEMKTLATVARGLFWRGYGHVWSVINDQYILILGRVETNHYDIILAHRSSLTLFGVKADTVPMRDLFIEGDKLSFVAVPSPERFMVQWIATHISPDVDGHIRDEIGNYLNYESTDRFFNNIEHHLRIDMLQRNLGSDSSDDTDDDDTDNDIDDDFDDDNEDVDDTDDIDSLE